MSGGNSYVSPLAVAWSQGKTAAWRNRWPAVFLTLFGIAIVVGYFQFPPMRSKLEVLGDYKTRFGFAFSIISTSIFGGLLPMMLPPLFGRRFPKSFWFLLITNVLFWAYKGFEIDLLYQGQAFVFGEEQNWKTVAVKVLFDQIVYAPLMGLLNCVLFYIWRDQRFSLVRTRSVLGKNWYVHKVLPALISNWCVWLPSVLLIYSLPLALQLPVQNLILCFWVLILVFFTDEEIDESNSEAGS